MTLRAPAFNDALKYGFEWFRITNEIGLQEGVVNPTDHKVVQAAAGLQRVDIGAGVAMVKGDSGTAQTGAGQGLFLVVNDATVPSAVTLAGSHATLPRVDQIILRVRDSSDLGSGADAAIYDFLTGTPTSGATLDNRTGAAALPNDCVRLADVLVPAASTAVTNGNIRDRRPWAEGASAFWRATPGADYATGTGSESQIGAVRVECSGLPVRVVATALEYAAATPLGLALTVKMDGAVMPSGATQCIARGNAGDAEQLTVITRTTPTPGSHLFTMHYGGTLGATSNIYNNAANAPQFEVCELLAGGLAVNG